MCHFHIYYRVYRIFVDGVVAKEASHKRDLCSPS